MSRRPGVPWAATAVPETRRRWCAALDGVVARHSDGLLPKWNRPGADSVRIRRLQAKLATAIEVMKAESEALQLADLYWVSRDMTDLALDAATTLPEWTPAVTAPCANGLLCWAKPAGMVPYGPTKTATDEIPWDAVWWWTRPDGRLQVTPASRFGKRPDLLAPFEVSTPLWAAHDLVVDADRLRSEEANGTEDMHPFLSVVGAAWLLMGQPGVTDRREIAGDRAPRPPSGLPAGPNLRTSPRVTIVELRRPVRPIRDQQPGDSGERRFSRRWWVGGHWRQQACGANMAQRRPTWIAPYVKGPLDKPMTSDRVYVWRR